MTEANPSTLAPERDEINLLDVVIALGEEKEVLFGIFLLATLSALVYALTLTPIYTARTTLTEARAEAETEAEAGAHAQAQHYAALLKSRTIQDNLIEQLNLKKVWAVDSKEKARRMLEGVTRITVEKQSNIVSIEVDDPSPDFAARLANGYTEALRHRLDETETSKIRYRRESYAALIERLKSHPMETEEVRSLARAQLIHYIRKRESEYAALRQSAPQADPMLARRIRELKSMNAQLDELESISRSNSDQRKAIFGVLHRQHEQARLDEARKPPPLEVIDVAMAPDQKSKPRRAQIVGLAGIAGCFIGVLVVFIRRGWRKMDAGRLAELKRAWSLLR